MSLNEFALVEGYICKCGLLVKPSVASHTTIHFKHKVQLGLISPTITKCIQVFQMLFKCHNQGHMMKNFHTNKHTL